MIKIINPELNDMMRYPVGRYIYENIGQIKEMVASYNSIEEFKGKEINLICRGSSGAIIAGIFASLMPVRCYIFHVKKDGENSHHGQCGRINNCGDVNVIIDDFIASGSTMNAIYEKLLIIHDLQSISIDCVCITSTYSEVNFTPKYVICGEDNI